MNLTLVAPPAVYPVNIEEVKEYCRIEDTDNDNLISGFIMSAVELAENATRRRFISQQWRLDLSEINGEVKLPYPNLISVDSFQYYDSLNVLQSFTGYDVDGVGNVGTLIKSVGNSWPTAYSRPDAYQITFTCGYTDIGSVPSALKNAISTIVWMLFDGRGEHLDGQFLELLLGPFIMHSFYE